MQGFEGIIFGVLFCIVLLVSFFWTVGNKNGNKLQARFVTSGFIAGLFFYCTDEIYFDPKFKLFGVMANFLIAVGALTGGVVGMHVT